MTDSTDSNQASPGPESLSPWDLVRQVVEKINVQAFLFAIVIVVLMALLGENIPSGFRALIYIVVIAGLLIHFWQVTAPVWVERQEKKRQTEEAAPEPAVTPGPAPRPQPLRPRPPGPGAPATLTDYLAWLAPHCNELKLRVIDPAYADERGRSLVTLDDVYTDLNTTTRVPLDEGRGKARRRADRPEAMEAEETRILSALEAVSRRGDRCVVLTGDPGSGKSTFANRLAYCLAMSRLDPLRAGEWLERLAPWPFDFKVPVTITLLDFATRGLPADPHAESKAGHLVSFIRAELARSALGDFGDELMAMLRDPNQGGLLLLDGLDEVPEPGRQRVQIRQAVEDFAAAFPHCRIVVTCRDYAYDDPKAPWILRGFRRHRLADFDEEKIHYFIDRWIAASAPIENWDEEKVKAKAGQFKDEVQPPRSAAQLAPRPILLQLMATLFAKGGALPGDRAKLYADSVELLLDHWQKAKVVYRDGQPIVEGGILNALDAEREQLEQALYNVAYQAHLRQAQSEDRSLQQAADIRERDLKADLEAVLGRDAGPVVDYIQKRAGLLLGRGGERYAFPHRTFQEYLTACHLTGLGDFHERMARHVYADAEWWREVFLLAALQSKKQAAVTLIAFLCAGDFDPTKAAALPENRWRLAALAAESAVEVGLPELARRAEAEPQGSDFYPLTRERLAGWLAGLLETRGVPLSARERANAGRHLAALGDSRFRADACHLPDEPLLGFVQVPAGAFLMGTREEDIQALLKRFGGERGWYERETPRHTVELPAYYMARYPVTTAQFRAFVQGSGYQAQEPWERYSGPGNHPVVAVTWYDAVKYCHWLTEQLRDWGGTPEPLATLLRAGLDGSPPWVVRLPTEAEWEKAARGADGRLFPWSDEPDPDPASLGRRTKGRANYADKGLGSASAVGCFPGGASPYGCLDMAGNVWEWSHSLYKAYPYRRDDGRENPRARGSRVLRGGAFYSEDWDFRCAFRNWYYPVSWDYGFRVVVAPNFISGL